MQTLPQFPSSEHLKKQAKDLLGQCIAQEPQARRGDDRATQILNWLALVYAGEFVGDLNRAKPSLAARVLAQSPDIVADDPYLACSIGDVRALREQTERDPQWVNRAGGPLRLPPLVAVTHSSLLRLPDYREHLHQSARYLLQNGADPNQSAGSRWPPASVSEPSKQHLLSALYGAAGQNHDPELTELLLGAGANPNDGESLYHSLESIECTRLLLQAGAHAQGALGRALDFDDVRILQLLLTHGCNANEPANDDSASREWGRPLLAAIRRRRSPAHVQALLSAGADPNAKTLSGISAYRLALHYGLDGVVTLLVNAGAAETLSDEDRFVAACSRADKHEALQLQSLHPELPRALPESALRLLPELAAAGSNEAVKVMVDVGWPIETRGGDWNASALNAAVFRGDAGLTRFLLENGASWQERHGYDDNVTGTLSWASCNKPVPSGDWLGCAKALVAHGMPYGQPDPQIVDCVLVDGQRQRFSDDVTEFLIGRSAQGT